MNIFAQIGRRLRTYFPRSSEFGGHRIELPAGHPVDWIRIRHARYDEPLADLARLMVRKHPDLRIIDIGANVGYATALMVITPHVRSLCIEGNPAFLPRLRRNLARISPKSELESNFVSPGSVAHRGDLVTRYGTASVALAESGQVELLPLAEILTRHPDFAHSHILKVDTDGLDAKIILGAADLIRTTRPVLHIEYSPFGEREVEQECRAMMAALVEWGYTQFHVYDNFGNHMMRLSALEMHHVDALNAYVRASRQDIRPAVFYYDICAMTDDDRDISDALLTGYLQA